MDRPETIEDTGDLIRAEGGQGLALRVDHEDIPSVESLIGRIDADHGRLDLLVNDIFGGDRYMESERPLWEHDLTGGLRMLRMGIDTHLITATLGLPLLLKTGGGLLIEMTDGTAEYNRTFRRGVGFYYDQVKAAVGRIVVGLTAELDEHPVTACAVTPGWLRSESMLAGFGVEEATWRVACEREPSFAISESPTYVARGVAALAADPDAARFAGHTLTSRQLSDIYGVTDVDGSRPDCWGHLAAHGSD